MDLSIAQKRLQQLKATTSKQSNLWKPSAGKTIIRIVPYKYNSKNPFIELYFHFELVPKRSVLSPSSFGEKDPIVLFAEKLKRTGNKDDWRMARKLEPKMRVFAPIIVRGEEKSGVRFWGFGKKVYEQLLGIVKDEDFGPNIEDVDAGHDITVEFTTAEEAGKDYPETFVRPKPAKTPLTSDPSLREKLLNEQKEITEVYTKPTYEELEEMLEKYMNPEGDGGVEVAPAPTGDDEDESSDALAPKPKVDVEEKERQFDEIFSRAKKSAK